MSGTWALMKIALNDNFHWSWMRVTYGRERKRLFEPLLILLALLIGGPLLFYVYVMVLNVICDQGAAFGQPALVLALAILLAQMIIGLFGIYWLMSAFYFSRDLPQLVPLPLTPQAVLGGKFLQVMVNELFVALCIVAPARVYTRPMPVWARDFGWPPSRPSSCCPSSRLPSAAWWSYRSCGSSTSGKAAIS